MMVTVTDTDTLIGYKEIAGYLGISESHAKRLARAGMPIVREEGKDRGYVRVSVAALAAWWATRINKYH